MSFLEASTSFYGQVVYIFYQYKKWNSAGVVSPTIRDSIVVSISACHADDPGSIPGRGVLASLVYFVG